MPLSPSNSAGSMLTYCHGRLERPCEQGSPKKDFYAPRLLSRLVPCRGYLSRLLRWGGWRWRHIIRRSARHNDGHDLSAFCLPDATSPDRR